MKYVHLFSGGLDSTTLLYELLRAPYYRSPKVECLSFDYGQTHRIELERAREIAEEVGVDIHRVELPRIYQRCALVGGRILPSGETDAAVVPNRNMVMLSIAVAYALEHGAAAVTWAANADDAELFPDCRREFWWAMNQAVRKCHTRRIDIHAPYIDLEVSKRGVVEKAREFCVPIDRTWSCYSPTQDLAPCGKCGACVVRNRALGE